MDPIHNANNKTESTHGAFVLDTKLLNELEQLWTYDVDFLQSKIHHSFSIYRILDSLSFSLPKKFNEIANACFNYYNSKTGENGKRDIFTLQSAITYDKLISYLIKKGLQLDSKSDKYNSWEFEGDIYLPPKDSIERAIINDNVEDFLSFDPNPKLVYEFLACLLYTSPSPRD